MTTLRKANVKCHKCDHAFVVHDNGGFTKAQADKGWKNFDEAFAMMDRAFAKLSNVFH